MESKWRSVHREKLAVFATIALNVYAKVCKTPTDDSMVRPAAELETARVSRTPAHVITANGEVQTNEVATVCIKD